MSESRSIVEWVLIIASAVYLLNLGGGVVEVIPDNIPVAGNLDEGLAAAIITYLTTKK